MEKEKNDNLEVFLQAATPHLRWRSASIFMVDECFQAPSNVWQLDSKKDEVDYFTLQDLWEHYAESSVYGLAVPARLESGKTTITQHFVPYLSALQLYTTKPLLASSRGSMASETDSWSDGSTGDKLSRSWDAALSDDDYSSQDSSSSLSAKQDGCLNFQYIEWSSPYERVPLADKFSKTMLVAAAAGVLVFRRLGWRRTERKGSYGHRRGALTSTGQRLLGSSNCEPTIPTSSSSHLTGHLRSYPHAYSDGATYMLNTFAGGNCFVCHIAK